MEPEPAHPAARTRHAGEVFGRWADDGRDEGMEAGHRRTAGQVLLELLAAAPPAPVGPQARFLDLGCGNAWAARDAAMRGLEAWGVDASRGMLRKAWAASLAARGAGRAAPRGLVRAALQALPFPDACFDVAFSVEAFYYAPRVDEALAEAARVLRPGAELHVVVDHYEENEASHAWPAQTGVPMHLLGEAAWGRLVREAGFEDVVTRRVLGTPGEGQPYTWTEGSLHIRGARVDNRRRDAG